MKTRPIISGMVLLMAGLFASYPSGAQAPDERIICRLPFEQNEPVAITEIRVNSESVAFDKRFRATDDWLSKLVISVKNTSDKSILFASIQLQFPGSDSAKGIMSAEDMSYGNSALQQRLPNPGDSADKIAPGETVEIRLTTDRFVDLRKLLTASGFPESIPSVSMRINRVIFVDDLMWSRGATLRRDPNNPKTWINSDMKAAR